MSRPDTKIVTVQKDPNFIEMASADAKYPEGIGRLTRTPSSPLIPLDEVVRVVEEEKQKIKKWMHAYSPEGKFDADSRIRTLDSVLTALKELGK